MRRIRRCSWRFNYTFIEMMENKIGFGLIRKKKKRQKIKVKYNRKKFNKLMHLIKANERKKTIFN